MWLQKRFIPCNSKINDRDHPKFYDLTTENKDQFTPTQLKTTGWNIPSTILLGQKSLRDLLVGVDDALLGMWNLHGVNKASFYKDMVTSTLD